MVRPLHSPLLLAFLALFLVLGLGQADLQAQVTIFGHQWFCKPLLMPTPKPPRVRYKWGCANPYTRSWEWENYGYSQSSWRPWVDQRHCTSEPGLPPIHPVPQDRRADQQPDEMLHPPTPVPQQESEPPKR